MLCIKLTTYGLTVKLYVVIIQDVQGMHQSNHLSHPQDIAHAILKQMLGKQT